MKGKNSMITKNVEDIIADNIQSLIEQHANKCQSHKDYEDYYKLPKIKEFLINMCLFFCFKIAIIIS